MLEQTSAQCLRSFLTIHINTAGSFTLYCMLVSSFRGGMCMDFLAHHSLRTSASRFATKEALVQGSQRLSYEQIEELTNRLAHVLRGSGLGRGDRVGIFLDRSVHEVLAIYGITKAGGVFVPINPLLFSDQVWHIVNDCGIKGIITSNTKLASIQQILPKCLSVKFLITTDGTSNSRAIPPILHWEEMLS